MDKNTLLEIGSGTITRKPTSTVAVQNTHVDLIGVISNCTQESGIAATFHSLTTRLQAFAERCEISNGMHG